MKQIRPFLFAMAVGLFVHQAAEAQVVRLDQFVDYNTGNLGADTGTGSGNGWENNVAQVTLTNGSGSVDGTGLGLVASAGDRVFVSAVSNFNSYGPRNKFVGTNNAAFPNSSDTNIYYSFLYKFNNAADISANGEKLFLVNRANSGINSGVITAPHWEIHGVNVGGQIQLGIYKPTGATTNFATTNIASGQTVFIVIRQHIIPGAANDVDEFWINPPANTFGTIEANVPPSSASTSDGAEDQSSTTGPGRFWIGAGANAEFDEFRVGTTWADVTPPLGQCNTAGVTASPGSITQSAELTATFNVVGSGTSPTYQWQLSTNSGTTWNNIDGATKAAYTTPVLSLSDSGNQYRAIVHVACDNSSATSGVATVTLTAPVVTPLGIFLDDTFEEDDRSAGPVNETNSVWFTAGTLTDNLTTFQQGGNMLGTPVSGSSSLWLGYFTETNQPPVHLAVGRAIRVTMDFMPNAFTSHTNNASLRFGLFDYADGGTRITQDGNNVTGSTGNGVGVRGYMLNLDFGPTFSVNSPVQLMARNNLGDINLMGTTGDYLSLGSGPAGGGYTGAPAFQAATLYTLQFTVARTGNSSVDITALISGGGTNWMHTATETNFAYHRFDSFAIRPNSLETSADSFTFPEFVVNVVEGTIAVPPFNITGIELIAPDAVKLTWNSVNGISYQIQSRDSLNAGGWVTNATVAATSPSTSYTNSPIPGGVTQRYYRVVATP